MSASISGIIINNNREQRNAQFTSPQKRQMLELTKPSSSASLNQKIEEFDRVMGNVGRLVEKFEKNEQTDMVRDCLINDIIDTTTIGLMASKNLPTPRTQKACLLSRF